MKYRASTGGHAPSYLREALADWLDGNPEDPPEIDQEAVSLHWLTGQLWNSTDIMPWIMCEDLHVPFGSTYAKGARKVRANHTEATV